MRYKSTEELTYHLHVVNSVMAAPSTSPTFPNAYDRDSIDIHFDRSCKLVRSVTTIIVSVVMPPPPRPCIYQVSIFHCVGPVALLTTLVPISHCMLCALAHIMLATMNISRDIWSISFRPLISEMVPKMGCDAACAMIYPVPHQYAWLLVALRSWAMAGRDAGSMTRSRVTRNKATTIAAIEM